MTTRQPRTALAGAMAAIALVLAACSAVAPPTRTAPTPAGTPFDTQAVDSTVGLLASAGVPVRVRPADPPLVPVERPAGYGLLRFQARNLALELNAGGGTLGRDLDAFAAAAGTPPLSPLIAGWLRTADTPAARAAASLVPAAASGETSELVIPGVVMAMFVADSVPPASSAAGVAGRSAGSAVAAEGDFCSQVAVYLSGVLEPVLAEPTELAPPWIESAIQLYADIEPDPTRLHAAVGALALLVYATSISRPWAAALSAVPDDVHYIVGGDELTPPSKALQLIVNRGEGAIAEEADDCAAMADVDLAAQSEADGIPVSWVIPDLEPHAVEIEGDLELEELGTVAGATLEYQTRGETADAHRNGTLNTATVTVGAVVERQEIAALETVIGELLTGSDLGAAAPNVAATYARLQPALRGLLHPRASARLQVSWHAGQQTPEPSLEATPDERPDDQGDTDACDSGCAMSNGDPHIVTIDDRAYDFMAAGEFVALRSSDGSFELQARQEPYGESDSVSINTALAMRAGSQRIGIYANDVGSLDVMVDGAIVDATSAPLTVDGVTITRVDAALPSLEAAFADGTRVMAVGQSQYGISVTVDPSDSLRAGAAGIMGPVPPGGMGVPALPDGAVLPETSSTSEYHAALYGPFEDAWRVTAATSLFDYAAGTGPDTYTLPAFPAEDEILTLADLTPEQIAAGEAACNHLGIEILRQQCIFDVAVTGDSGFGQIYDFSAEIVEKGSIVRSGQHLRVVNLYSDDTGPTALDVYAWTDAGAALVATVPHGAASAWLDPGSVIEFGRAQRQISIQRQGEPVSDRGLNLVDLSHDLAPGSAETIVVSAGEGGRLNWVGGREARTSTLLERGAPALALEDAPADGALLFLGVEGLVYTHPGVTFFTSAGKGCLHQPGFEGLATLSGVTGESGGVYYQGPLVVPPGPGAITLHQGDQSMDPFEATCDTPPIHGPVPFEIGAGERAHLLLYAAADDASIRSLIVPFDAP